ncbi:sulfatase [Streptomyces sp. NPDC005907]|uniref:sulfatase n=1 Tax=Streptomyces sp. NPDC005907 TaxID=3154571 RepID=UPI0033F271DA
MSLFTRSQRPRHTDGTPRRTETPGNGSPRQEETPDTAAAEPGDASAGPGEAVEAPATASAGPEEVPADSGDASADPREVSAGSPDASAGPGEASAVPGEPPTDPGGSGAPRDTPAAPDGRPRGAPRGLRARHPALARGLARGTDVLAFAAVVIALLLPNRLGDLRAAAFARLPVEAVLGAAVLIVLPRRPRVAVAVTAGLGLGALTVLNLLDLGFDEFLGRGFNLVLDWTLFGDARAYLKDSVGPAGATAAAVAVVVLVLAVLVLMALAVVRLARLLARHRPLATRSTLALGTVWVLCTATGVQFGGVPVAAGHAAAGVQDRAQRVQATLRDEAAFAEAAREDTFGGTPPEQLLTGLRGKDVMFTFIESYGRSAVEDPVTAPGVDATLASATERLGRAGYAAKSGWLTSATYGGSSWLGHSTFLSGLWIDNQQRYRTVTAGDHLTLTGAFRKTGAWRTVGIMPGVQKAWPEAEFYGLDHLYDARNLGYRGPKFSWSTMPDQYALAAFERLEHGRKHDKPLMSEIILTSSHQPWAPIPKTVPQDQVGDGSVYEGIQRAGKKPADVFYDSAKVKQEYGRSIQYSVRSLIDYVIRYGGRNTVLVFLGDHQPMARVSGDHASRDVPCAIVAHDPEVLERIAGWGWTDGLQPGHDAPVWKMDSFRDRFLTAYGSTPSP